jgi:hypothetical protein
MQRSALTEAAVNCVHRCWVLEGAHQSCCLQGDKVVLKVNKLTSTKTQLPYEYYSMPYCRPEKIMPSAENLGEVLRGDRIENSPYEVPFSTSASCSASCRYHSGLHVTMCTNFNVMHALYLFMARVEGN